MAIEGFPIYGVLRTLIRWLPGFYLRHRYSTERLAKLVYLDFQPRGDSALVNLGGAASVQLNLQLINLLPFPVEIDRASFRFHYAGGSANLTSLSRKVVEAGAIENLYLSTELTDGHANHMSQNQQGNKAWLDGHIEFNCSVQPFSKIVGSLTDIRLTILNANARQKT